VTVHSSPKLHKGQTFFLYIISSKLKNYHTKSCVAWTTSVRHPRPTENFPPRPMAIVLCVNAIKLNGRPPSQQRPLPAACRFRGHHSCGGGLVGASGTSWGPSRDPDFSHYATLQNPRVTSIPLFSWYLLVVSRTSKPFGPSRCQMVCRASSR